MLTLITGRAGTGKTSFVMNDIKRRMEAGERGLLLIVPEQYSHDAERQLCAVCGNSLSLHGEALSFTRLCARVFSEAGGAPQRILDTGGQMLVMYHAIESVASKLSIYGKTGIRTELVNELLETVRELKSFGFSPLILEKTALRASTALGRKLSDLALILGAYESILHIHGADPSDRLNLLAEYIGESCVGDSGHIYFDGFNDFTVQEFRVVRELIRKNTDVTICLTLDADDAEIVAAVAAGAAGGEAETLGAAGARGAAGASGAGGAGGAGAQEVFELPRRTAVSILEAAKEYGIEVRTVVTAVQDTKAPELAFLEKRLFSYEPAEYTGQCGAIRVLSAPNVYTECEYAAYTTLELVRAGYRWRDVGVMARNWDDYGAICENVFEKYGVPFFTGGRGDVSAKPPSALIDAALEIAASGLEYRQMFRYLKTGLAGVSADDYAELENYIIKWRVRGSMWARDWILPPSGYGDGDNSAVLEHLNTLRRRVTQPLYHLRDGIKGVTDAGGKIKALYAFLEEIGLPECLREKSRQFEDCGETRLADEYTQLWGVIVNAMESGYAILGNVRISAQDFRKIFMLTLSSYDVGVIPVSLDRTALGGMAMNRRRDLKCLIVLGAADDNMPMLTGSSGAFSDSERDELAAIGAGLQTSREDRLLREMNMLYSAFTLPSRMLVVTYPAGARPSLIVKRIKSIFSITEETPAEEEIMSSAPAPCLELAAMSGKTNGSIVAAAAKEYFLHSSERAGAGAARAAANIRLLEAGAEINTGRTKLSGSAADALYGGKLSLSPSRVNRYYACPFAHFLYSGLRLAPRAESQFDAPEAGTFVHYVLEGVSRRIGETTGFKGADEALIAELTSQYIDKYAHDELFGFEGKNERFIYLFRRLEENVRRVVEDMLEELKRSDFEPLSFELDLSDILPEKEHLRGVIDRVDGWVHNGRQYLRVIDYKTGRKSFNLTDILQGRDMQMLIYLFALMEYGSGIYGRAVAPSGVLYVPARDITLKAARNTPDDELMKLRGRELRRSGLILDDADVIEAMENSGDKKYLPVKTSKDGAMSGESLVSTGQVEILSNHVNKMLQRASDDILSGGIECSPYYKSDNDNACLYCEYHAVCGFDESAGGRRRYVPAMKANEVWEAMRSGAKELF